MLKIKIQKNVFCLFKLEKNIINILKEFQFLLKFYFFFSQIKKIILKFNFMLSCL